MEQPDSIKKENSVHTSSPCRRKILQINALEIKQQLEGVQDMERKNYKLNFCFFRKIPKNIRFQGHIQAYNKEI